LALPFFFARLTLPALSASPAVIVLAIKRACLPQILLKLLFLPIMTPGLCSMASHAVI
jgi:hypothetical protein